MTTSPDEPHYKNVMIDIETMSLHPHNALILSIGMIEFDPSPMEGLKIGATSLILPNLEQQLLLGREVTASTQEFWRKQSPEAREHWAGGLQSRLSLAFVCQQVRAFCQNATAVWANGIQFDLSNIVELNRQLGDDGQPEMWHYQAPRDMRSVVKWTTQTRLVPIGDALDIPGVPHEPVYDCIYQAWQVWSRCQS